MDRERYVDRSSVTGWLEAINSQMDSHNLQESAPGHHHNHGAGSGAAGSRHVHWSTPLESVSQIQEDIPPRYKYGTRLGRKDRDGDVKMEDAKAAKQSDDRRTALGQNRDPGKDSLLGYRELSPTQRPNRRYYCSCRQNEYDTESYSDESEEGEEYDSSETDSDTDMDSGYESSDQGSWSSDDDSDGSSSDESSDESSDDSSDDSFDDSSDDSSDDDEDDDDDDYY
ncbi:hypothetical protein GGR51DRAFT_4933 [Nemania sp. FL0031]|nr:hypothetical protein GGR51DRAFT_4933 [Nemania sp. FL0031]